MKDVAIEGDLGDLASARGQIGDNIRINTASDLNAYTKLATGFFRMPPQEKIFQISVGVENLTATFQPRQYSNFY